MKTTCLMLLPVFAQSSRYGLLRVRIDSANVIDQRDPMPPSQRSLYEEDFEVFFRGLLGGQSDLSMSMMGLSLSMPVGGLSMPMTGFSMPYPDPTPTTIIGSVSSTGSGTNSSDSGTNSDDDSITDSNDSATGSNSSGTDTVGEASPSAAPETSTTSTGDVAQTTDGELFTDEQSDSKSSNTAVVVVGVLSVVGVAMLAGFAAKKMSKGSSDASVSDQSNPPSVV